MNQPTTLAGRRAPMEALVITQTEEGFRVYSVHDPLTTYIVSGTYEAPRCTCPDFNGRGNGHGTICAHIHAVRGELERTSPDLDPVEVEERVAIQNEVGGGSPMAPQASNGSAEMLIKRSVSPDGRIDSLSVEFSCPVDQVSGREIQAKADTILSIQSVIVARFLKGNGQTPRNGNGATDGSSTGGNGAQQPSVPISAKLVSVQGMDGRYGRRLFIRVEADGHVLRLFGNKTQLADAIRAAGFYAPDKITEGLTLNVPCQVITKPSEDGRYTNIDRVLPVDMSATQLQRRPQ